MATGVRLGGRVGGAQRDCVGFDDNKLNFRHEIR